MYFIDYKIQPSEEDELQHYPFWVSYEALGWLSLYITASLFEIVSPSVAQFPGTSSVIVNGGIWSTTRYSKSLITNDFG